MKINYFFAIILSVLSAAILSGCCCKQPVIKNSNTNFAAEAMQLRVKSGEIPGFINIFYKNGVQETACVGWADVDKKIPISMDQMFMQCSQTKGFCGVTIAILIDEGKISLDDPVSKYLPEFKNLKVYVNGKNSKDGVVPAKNVLTIRMVMNHSGGFHFEIPTKQKKGWTAISLRETAEEAASVPLFFEPGTKTRYSNTGIDIGAAIVEVVSGKPWDVFLKERVFDKLDMTDATFNPSDEQLSRAISMYNIKNGTKAKYRKFHRSMPRPYNGKTVHPSAGAGLWITANDQYKFYKMLMNCGVGDNGVRIISEDTFKSVIASSTRPAKLGKYSLGLYADAQKGTLGHGGAWGTFANVNWKRKELNMFVIQATGGRYWKKDIDKAAEKFFSMKTDNTGVDAYTGRMQ